MAAPSNENQGLKIAVACFAALSVILAVMTYFGFKSYADSEKKLEVATKERDDEKKAQEDLLRVVNEAKDKMGYGKTDKADLVKAIAKDIDELSKRVAATGVEGRKAIAEYKGSGGALAKVDELSQSLDTILSGLNDPAKTLQSTTFRLQELLNNQALLATYMGAEFADVRRYLEGQNQVNQAALDVQVAAAKGAKTDLEAEHTKHETDRQALMAKVDTLQSDTNRQAQEIANLKNQIAAREDEVKKQNEDMLTMLRDYRDRLERKETVLDKKDGVLTYVDYGQNLVRTDLTSTMGAREQMIFTVFDKNAPIPTDKYKGTIELTEVGPTGSVGRIIETKDSIHPFRAGDQVYSPAWNSDGPMLFAMLGKIDVNRDGKDDRQDLKRMIEQRGGRVAYDLPPPGAGLESGKLTPLIAWYVVDERQPFYPLTASASKAFGEQDEEFQKKRTEAIRIARLDGIRPKPIERLLAEFGYSYTFPDKTGVEAANTSAINSLIKPRGSAIAKPVTGDGNGDQPAEGDNPDDMPKEEPAPGPDGAGGEEPQ